MFIGFTLKQIDKIPEGALREACTEAEKELAKRVKKDTEPYVPALTGEFSDNTRVVDNVIIYESEKPMVRYLYQGKRMVNAATGRGPYYIKDVGYRYPRGAKLKATSDPLHYTHDKHPLATAHWMEMSSRDNIIKWNEYLAEVILRGLK